MQYVNSLAASNPARSQVTGEGEVLALKGASLYIVHVQYTETLWFLM